MRAGRRANGEIDLATLPQSLSSLSDLSPYSLILAVDVASPSELLSLADAAWKQDIPLIKVETCGFYGTLRPQVKELTSTFAACARAIPTPKPS